MNRPENDLTKQIKWRDSETHSRSPPYLHSAQNLGPRIFALTWHPHFIVGSGTPERRRELSRLLKEISRSLALIDKDEDLLK
ncbi:MAG: hypothetical protein AAF722_10275 [Cyanobacteria bacterium P01_C01_bin.70]